MSYSIPLGELTLTDIKNFRRAAREAGIARAVELGVARNRSELVVRDAMPFTDFGAGAVGWVAEQFITGVIAAAGWGSPFSAGALPANAPTLARTKVAVFYRYGDVEAAPQIAGMRFRVGGQAASTKATFQFQTQMQCYMEPVVYFSEPVVYDPEDVVYIEALFAGAVAVGERCPFGCFIIERLGPTVS